MPKYDLEAGQTKFHVEIHTSAKNGSYFEQIKIIDINEPNWIMAHEIRVKLNSENDYKLVFSEISPNFPRRQGMVFWTD